MLRYAAGYLSQKAPIFFAGDFCSVSLNITFFIETKKYDKSETKQEMAILSFKGIAMEFDWGSLCLLDA